MANVDLVPLESNPNVMDKLLRKFGVPPIWYMIDVLEIEEGTELCLVPKPVLAVMLLFPVTAAYEKYKKTQEKREKALKMEKCAKISSNMFFVKQHHQNSGGTLALIHSIANNTKKIELIEGTFKRFVDEAKGLDPEARATLLENEYDGILSAHAELAQEGQSKVPRSVVPADHHFITFVHVDGSLYELDGRRSFPVNHGPTTAGHLLKDAIKVIKQFIARDPKQIGFTVLAMCRIK